MAFLVAPLEALTDSRLTDPERRVLLALFSWRSKTSPVVWPSTEEIAVRANIKDRTWVSKLTTSLSQKGWLEKKKRGFTGGNEYTLKAPPIDASESNLGSQSNLDNKTNSKLDNGTNLDSQSKLGADALSKLDSEPKCNEQTIEQTNLTTSCEVVCSEPEVSKPQRRKQTQLVAVDDPSDQPVISIPTNRFNVSGEEAKILDSQYRRFCETYPAVDVWQTLLRIRSWAVNNPAKRKTLHGMNRFVDTWLAKEQDRPRINPGGNGQPVQFLNSRERNAQRAAHTFDYRSGTDFGDPHCE